MRRAPRMTAALVAALFVAAALAATAVVAAITDNSNNIDTARSLVSSPTTGTVDATTDVDDVYKVEMAAGQWLYASLSGPSGSDFDFYLFEPGVRSVAGTQAAVAYSERQKSSSERIIYQAKKSGTHYLDVCAFAGTGAYSITYGFPTSKASVTAVAPSTTAWGSAASIEGTVTGAAGAAAAGETVHLYHKPYGATSYTKVADTKVGSSGSYRFKVIPKKRTYYQVRHVGSPKFLPGTSSSLKITPRAYLSTPNVPTTVRAGVSFLAFGYLKPRHPEGGKHVKISCYRKESGAWVLRKSIYATSADYSTYTKYRARFSLPSKGEWKFVASIAGDSVHVSTTSGARYRTVR